MPKVQVKIHFDVDISDCSQENVKKVLDVKKRLEEIVSPAVKEDVAEIPSGPKPTTRKPTAAKTAPQVEVPPVQLPDIPQPNTTAPIPQAPTPSLDTPDLTASLDVAPGFKETVDIVEQMFVQALLKKGKITQDDPQFLTHKAGIRNLVETHLRSAPAGSVYSFVDGRVEFQNDANFFSQTIEKELLKMWP